MGCTPAPVSLSVRVEEATTLATVPSGSALALVGEDAFLLGDDSPFLFHLKLPFDDHTVVRHLVQPEFSEYARIPKPLKPDWESVAEAEHQGRAHLFVFGSGSKSPERDHLLIIRPDAPTQPLRHSLSAFYDHLLQVSQTTREDLNLEGAVVAEQSLYLFNRGTNGLYRLPWQHFEEFLAGERPADQIQVAYFRFSLPQLAGQEARFSGGCFLPEANALLFTATVEDTQNWIDDGAVLGSFIGILPLDGLEEQQVKLTAVLQDEAGGTATDKVESIDLRKQLHEGEWLALAVTDNDDGTSKLLELRIKLK